MLTPILLTLSIATKPVAVMVHGAGGGGWEYEKWQPIFEREGFEVIAPDLVPAKAGLAQTGVQDYAAQVQKWIPDGRRVTLIGASMGGILALLSAGNKSVEAIVLVNSVPPKGIGVPWRSGRKSPQIPAIVEWSKGTLQDTRDSMPDSDEATIQAAFPRWRDESGQVLRELFAGVAAAAPKVPILVVVGEKDTDIPPAVSYELAEAFGADVHFYPGMSHVGPLLGTKAGIVARRILNWRREVLLDRR